MKKACNHCGYRLFRWSEWRDLNSRPLDPQSFCFFEQFKNQKKDCKIGNNIGAFEIPTFISVSNILILFRTDSERRLRSNRCAVMLLRASTLNNHADFRQLYYNIIRGKLKGIILKIPRKSEIKKPSF